MVHAHQGYDATTSNVTDISDEFEDHVGIFTVSSGAVETYLQRYNPVILRQNRSTRGDICEGFNAQNFGEAKGLGFDRVLILPTENYSRFLQGDPRPLRTARTEQALNKLYVAITRARYSVAFLFDEEPSIEGVSVWEL